MGVLEYVGMSVPVSHDVAVEPVDARPRQPAAYGVHALYQGESIALDVKHSALDHFLVAAAQYPDATAISVKSQHLTYAQLLNRVDCFAGWLRDEAQLRVGDRVAIYLPNSLSYLVAVYAAWRAQLVVVNLGMPNDLLQVQYRLQDSGAKVLVLMPQMLHTLQPLLLPTAVQHIVTTQAQDYAGIGHRMRLLASPKHWLSQFKQSTLRIRHVHLRSILHRAPATFSRCADAASGAVGASAADLATVPSPLAVIQYTSGVTGRAKGVALTHRNLSINHQQCRHRLQPFIAAEKIALCPLSLQSMLGLSYALAFLSVGGHVILTHADDLLATPHRLLARGAHSMLGTPYLYEQLLQKNLDWSAYAQLELLICGGTSSPPALHTEWQQKTGRCLCEGYGMTEASPVLALQLPDARRVDAAARLLPNTEACVVALDSGLPLGFDAVGELWVRGGQMTAAYWQHAGATSDAITPDGWFKTGDMVSLSADGDLTVHERQKDLLWVNNQVVFPKQLEFCTRAYSAVIDCIAVQDQRDQQQAVRLYVAARDDFSEDNLREHLRQHLPDQLLPDQITLVDRVPREKMGQLLRRLWRQGLPEGVIERVRQRVDRLESRLDRVGARLRAAPESRSKSILASTPASTRAATDEPKPPSDTDCDG